MHYTDFPFSNEEMKNTKFFGKALRIGAAFVAVMTLWCLWDHFVSEDSVLGFLASIVVGAVIYAVELAIIDTSRDK
jgi:hypothetical protein